STCVCQSFSAFVVLFLLHYFRIHLHRRPYPTRRSSDLRPLGDGGGRRGPRPPHDLLAQRAHRPAQCRRRGGGRGGGGGPGPGLQPQAGRPAGLLRQAGGGVRRRPPLSLADTRGAAGRTGLTSRSRPPRPQSADPAARTPAMHAPFRLAPIAIAVTLLATACVSRGESDPAAQDLTVRATGTLAAIDTRPWTHDGHDRT